MTPLKISGKEYFAYAVNNDDHDFEIICDQMFWWNGLHERCHTGSYYREDLPKCNWGIVADTKTAIFSSSFEVKIVMEKLSPNIDPSKRYIILKKID